MRARVAVALPLTGPAAGWGALALDEIARLDAERPGVVDWRIHQESAAPDAVAAEGCRAVIGHLDPDAVHGALARYRALGLLCLLPLLPAPPARPAGPETGLEAGLEVLSWTPDRSGQLAVVLRLLAALDLPLVHIPCRAGEDLLLAGEVAREVARRSVRTEVLPIDAGDLCEEGFDGAEPAVCRLRLPDAPGRRSREWWVSPARTPVERIGSAVRSLVDALEASDSGGLAAAVRQRSSIVLDARGGAVDGWKVIRLDAGACER